MGIKFLESAPYSLVGGFLLHLTFGNCFTWGNIGPYVISYMRSVGVDIRYSQGAHGFMAVFSAMALFMPIGGLLAQKINPKIVSLIGCLIMSLGNILTFYTLHDFSMFLLTYGLIAGAGAGISYTVPLVMLMKWYPSRSGFVSGVICGGLGAGAFVFNQVQTFFVNPSDIAATSVPFSKSPSEKYFEDPSVMKKVPQLFLLQGCVFLCIQLIALVLLNSPPENYQEPYLQESMPLLDAGKVPLEKKDSTCSHPNSSWAISRLEIPHATTPSVMDKADKEEKDDVEKGKYLQVDSASRSVDKHKKEEEEEYPELVLSPSVVAPEMTVTIDLHPLKAIKTYRFWSLFLMFSLNGIGVGVMASFWKVLGTDTGASDRFLSIIGSIGALCNAAGRIFWGSMSDETGFKKTASLAFVLWSVFLSLLPMGAYVNQYVYLLLVCVNYFCLGSNFGMFPAVTSRTFGKVWMGVTYGLLFFSQIIGTAIAANLATIFSQDDEKAYICYVTAVLVFVAGILAYTVPLDKSKKTTMSS